MITRSFYADIFQQTQQSMLACDSWSNGELGPVWYIYTLHRNEYLHKMTTMTT